MSEADVMTVRANGNGGFDLVPCTEPEDRPRLVHEQDYAKLEAELAEWRLRALTVESSEEDAQQAAVKFKVERDRLRDAIKRHRLDVWGDHEVGHPADCELYAGLQEESNG